MQNWPKKEIIVWKLQAKSWSFGFVVPDDREYWGGDFFVNKKHFNGAVDWSKVEAEQLDTARWKKPEAKILRVFTWKYEDKKPAVLRVVEWIYSWGKWNFWFIDVEGEEKWFFVYWHNKKSAIDGDKVKAEIIEFKDKEEGIVIEVLWQEEEILSWEYRDNEKFWFVLPDDRSSDIFIAGSRKWEAQDRDMVEVKIIKRWGKNPEWVIVRVL